MLFKGKMFFFVLTHLEQPSRPSKKKWHGLLSSCATRQPVFIAIVKFTIWVGREAAATTYSNLFYVLY